jgi:hypothetical protein
LGAQPHRYSVATLALTGVGAQIGTSILNNLINVVVEAGGRRAAMPGHQSRPDRGWHGQRGTGQQMPVIMAEMSGRLVLH